MKLYSQWRIPKGIAAVTIAILLVALAFSKPKPKNVNATPPSGDSTSEQA